jgi:hypothetical protein
MLQENFLASDKRSSRSHIHIHSHTTTANMSGWDLGNVYSTSVLPGEFGEQDSSAYIVGKFSRFIMDFRVDSVFIYRWVFVRICDSCH